MIFDSKKKALGLGTFIGIVLGLWLAAAAGAQTLAQVAAKADTLATVIGDYRTVIPCSALDANRPTLILGDGGYPERFRLKQIGCAIDAAVTLVGSFAVDLNALRQRVAALEAAPSGGGGGTGNTVNGDLVVTGRLTVMQSGSSFGGPQKADASNFAIQLHGRGGAEIVGFSNEQGLDAQNPSYVHCGVFSVSNDAGVRMVKGGYWGNNGRVWCDPNRALAIMAFDSMGDWSISYAATPESTEPGQALVYRQYPDLKKGVLTSMRAAPWQLCLGASNGLNDFSKLYCPPYGAFGVSRPRSVSRPLTQAELFGHTERR